MCQHLLQPVGQTSRPPKNADRLKPLQPMVPGSLMYHSNRCARACCIDLILSPALTTKSVQKLVLSHLRSTTNQVRLLS